MNRTERKNGQAGFTLIEILVALILISLLVAAVFPVVTQQARQADAPRLANDLTNIRSGVELFNVNLRDRFPATLGQLTSAIASGGEGLGGLDFNGGHENRWDGPYIDAAGGRAISSGYGAVIDSVFVLYDADASHAAALPISAATIANADFIALSVTGLDSLSFERVNGLIDGDADTEEDAGYATGKLRALSADSDDAYYLATPFRQ